MYLNVFRPPVGFVSPSMGREKGSVDPLQAWRRKEKEKASKAKKKARDEKLSEIPAHRRDPAPLVSEIYRLSVLDYEGRLNSDMKQHRKRLMDQYQSIKKARTAAGIETIELVEFNPEAYEESKLKQFQAKRRKFEQPEISKSQESSTKPITTGPDLIVKGLPRLPDAPCPTEEELLALGLPPYSPFPYGADVEEENFPEKDEKGREIEELDNDLDVECENLNDLEAQLEAEYELFKGSIEQDDE